LLPNNHEWSTDGPIRITDIPHKKKASCLVSSYNYNFILQLIDRYSECHRLIRAVAILSKIVQYRKQKSKFNSTNTATDLHDATNKIIRAVQETEFAHEMSDLKNNNRPIKTNSKLLHFTHNCIRKVGLHLSLYNTFG
jgi:hypothetical protein